LNFFKFLEGFIVTFCYDFVLLYGDNKNINKNKDNLNIYNYKLFIYGAHTPHNTSQNLKRNICLFSASDDDREATLLDLDHHAL